MYLSGVLRISLALFVLYVVQEDVWRYLFSQCEYNMIAFIGVYFYLFILQPLFYFCDMFLW